MHNPTHNTNQCAFMAPGNNVSIAGRVIYFRKHGGVSFGKVIDQHGSLQFCLRKAENPEQYKAWRGEIKIGDIVYLSGETWVSSTGEKSILVTNDMQVLRHSMHPFPNKATGLMDPEAKVRKRYLDIITDPETKRVFQTRSKIISEIRRFLENYDFMEVETPILQINASGAQARPFSTHHNAYDTDMYLRIAPETYLKRAVAASFDRVYEIGKNFRNEGVDTSHLPEFTSLEFYAAYWDYKDNLKLFQEMLPVLLDVAGHEDGIVKFQDETYNFNNIPSVTFDEVFQKYVGKSSQAFQDKEIDAIFKEKVRPNLIQPIFVLDYPAYMSPLAHRSEDGKTVEQWQFIVGGEELVKCYTELTDPILQRKLLEEQMENRASGDEEAMMLEEDFLEMLEYGCPPCSGLGLGVDRLVALLTNRTSLREVVLFPTVL